MNTKNKIITACTAALVYCTPVVAFAASPTPAASPNSSPKAKTTAAEKAPAAETTTSKVKALPFHGTIATVEQAAKSFTIAGKEKSRIFKVTETTVITKGGAPATIADLVANEEVRGNYVKAADGSLEARTVKVGPMTDAEKAEKKPSKKKTKQEDASLRLRQALAEAVGKLNVLKRDERKLVPLQTDFRRSNFSVVAGEPAALIRSCTRHTCRYGGHRSAMSLPGRLNGHAKVGDEKFVFAFSGFLIGLTQQRGGMNGRDNFRRQF